MKNKKISNLQDIYDFYKLYYEKTGRKEFPTILLTLKLLPQISAFKEIDCDFSFYNINKVLIDQAIEEIEKDFHFTETDYAKYLIVYGDGLIEKNFEDDVIWKCYGRGIQFIKQEIGFKEYYTKEELFNKFCQEECVFSNLFDATHSFAGLSDFQGLTFDYLKSNVASGEDFFKDFSRFFNQDTIKITLTNIELDTLKECGNLTVPNRREKIEITLADPKEEAPKQIVKKQNN